MKKTYQQPEWAIRAQSIMSKKGITQEKLAEQIGFTQNAVSQWLHGLREPKLEILNVIAKELGVQPSFLVYGEIGEWPFCLVKTEFDKLPEKERQDINEYMSYRASKYFKSM